MDIVTVIVIGFLLLTLVFINIFAKPSYTNYIVLFIIIIVLSLFSAFRSAEIPDTQPYIENYEYWAKDIQSNGFFHYTSIMEIGFEFFAKICIILKLNYTAFFFVISLIQSFLFISIERKISNRYVLLAFALFYSFYGIYFQFIILRAGISTLLFFYAIFKCKNKYSRFLTFGLAFTFHYSALFGIILYYIFSKINLKVTFNLTVCSIILFIPIYILGVNKIIIDALAGLLSGPGSSTMLFYNKIYFYMVNYGDVSYKLPFRLIVNSLIFLWSLYMIEKYKIRRNKKINILINVTYVAVIVILLFGSAVPILRLSDFVMLSNVFLVIYIISRLKLRNINTLCLYKTDVRGNKVIVYNKLCISLLIMIFALCNLGFVYRITLNV